MKKIAFSLLCLLAITFVACSDKKNNTPEFEAVDTDQPITTEESTINNSNPTDVSLPPTSEASNITTPDNQGPLNPPHGEPGHNCDIAVGAPLSSASAAPASGIVNLPTAEQGSVTQKIQLETDPSAAPAPGSIMNTTTTTAPGMNPPHGQPGHDCGIPVGEPLKK